ncbi:MAG: GNAT family N-acetyltransferase [Anaerolineae bacterium]|nr:GNAT family N-acetyltransferase [Anaerolineae bacterium]
MTTWHARLAELMEDWGAAVRRDGWLPGLLVVGQDLVRLPGQHVRFKVVARSLSTPLPDLRPKVPIELRDFGPEDLDWVRQHDSPSTARLCGRRLKLGYRGFLALHQGERIGHAWCDERPDPSLARFYEKLEPGDMVCTDAYVAPASRGLGVQTTLTAARLNWLRALGYNRAIAYIDERNEASLAVWQKKLGAVHVADLHYVRLGPWRWVRYDER